MDDVTKSSNNDKRSFLDNFKTSTPIFTKGSTKTRNDSAYSSLVSPKTYPIINSNPLQIKESTPSYESPGTSYSSRNSALNNDDEIDELFIGQELLNSSENEVDKNGNQPFFMLDSLYRRSARNSPWTVRPDSAPLNEEEEDSDKEASYELYNSSNKAILVELKQCGLVQKRRIRHASMTDADNRNDIIASHLRQIADNMPSKSERKIRHKSCIINTETLSTSTTKRHSCSSFSDLLPNGVGYACDFFASVYSIYKRQPELPKVNSQSLHKLNNNKKIKNRYRSYTE